jgi:ribonucleoside-triphosphate reductase
VYDVSQLIKNTANTNTPSVETVHKKTGDAVIEEYTLLNVLPREVADAHVSGAINLDNLGTWILKPNEITHDLRYFLRNGPLSTSHRAASGLGRPPKNFEQLLAFVLNVLRRTAGEISGEQTLNYFNLFLAPFSRGLPPEEVKEKLHLLIDSLTQETNIIATIGLELVIPDFLKEKETIGPEGKTNGSYGDFEDESRRLALTLLELILEESKERPVFDPSIVIKLRPEAWNNSECQPILLLVHQLAGILGTPYFANLGTEKQRFASYAATGSRLGVEWKGDWELDTLQTGNMDNATINLPRIAYESDGKEARFFQLLDEQLEIAAQALEIKHQIIKQRLGEGLLPFLHQKVGENGSYFRCENATRTISLCGLHEAVYALHRKSLQKDSEALKFAEDILKSTNAFAKEHSRKPENRTVCSLVSSADASRRFAALDAERFGWATINAQGSKEQPFYTNIGIVPRNQEVSWQDRLPVEENFHKLSYGGHLTLLPLTEVPVTVEEMSSTTRQIANTRNVGFFAYDRVLSYCTNCRHIAYKILAKCPSCGEANTLINYSRFSAKYSST